MKRKRSVLIEGAAPTDGELMLRRIAEALSADRLPKVADRRAFATAIGQFSSGADPIKSLGLSRKRGAPRLTPAESFARHDVPTILVLGAMKTGFFTKTEALDFISRYFRLNPNSLATSYKKRAPVYRDLAVLNEMGLMLRAHVLRSQKTGEK